MTQTSYYSGTAVVIYLAMEPGVGHSINSTVVVDSASVMGPRLAEILWPSSATAIWVCGSRRVCTNPWNPHVWVYKTFKEDPRSYENKAEVKVATKIPVIS